MKKLKKLRQKAIKHIKYPYYTEDTYKEYMYGYKPRRKRWV